MRSLTDSGLYLHIPFCAKKCAYCDFYSAFSDSSQIDRYLLALIAEIKRWGGLYNRPIDSVYIGGGTPSLLEERIIPLLDAVRESFKVSDNAEITAELNPSSASEVFLSAAKKAGVNRLSIGVQSGIDSELKRLGRTHTALDAQKTVAKARELGFDNISLDLMLALPDSNLETLRASLDFITALSPEHISAYILKIEPKTALYAKSDLIIPDGDETADQYLFMCDYLKKKGFEHYEISNFAKNGMISRHNIKYWRCEEYLGIGPSAHSFINGERFYYPKDLAGFISSPKTVGDGEGGDVFERIMLALRLSEGCDLSEFIPKTPKVLEQTLEALQKAGLIELAGSRVSLTNKGMLVSNSIISEITELIYENL